MYSHNHAFKRLPTRITDIKANNIIVRYILIGIALTSTTTAYANQNYMDAFNGLYGKTGTNVDSCGVCHVDFDGQGSPLNQYGQDWVDNNQDFGIIDTFDSDGDGTDNIGEISIDFMPGWNCSNYETAQDAPADLNTYVDPAIPNCGVQPVPVDLDIAQFRVTKSVRIANVKPIGISLVVKNNGLTEGSATATIIGIQNGAEVYRQEETVSDGVGNGRTTFDFMSYTPEVAGEILWTATIADGDPDDDTATATTNVK